MPRMKLDDRDFNVKQLKNVDYQRSDIKRYDGEVPRTGTILICRVTRLWWTQSNDGTSAMKVLAVAEQNRGDRAKYNGLPVWDFLTFKPEAAFRYMPFLLTFQIELDDVKRHMMVADEPDRFGDVIESIGDWEVGSDDAVCKIVIKNDPQFGAEPDRDGWLELEGSTTGGGPDDDEPDDEDDEPTARPSRRAPARTASRSTSRSAGTRASRRQEPEPEDDDDEDEYDDEPEDEEEYDDEPEDEDDEDAEEAPPARSSRSSGNSRRAAPARSSARTSGRQPAARTARTPARGSARDGNGRGRSGDSARASRAAARDRRGRGSDEDPPF